MQLWLIALLAAAVMAIGIMAPDMDGRECFEDEAVVVMVQTWTGTHHEVARDTGTLYCAAWDNMRVINP